MYVCMYVCMYVYTCYVLINPPMPIHYVLAAVFASCFYVLIYLLQEWGHIFDYVRLTVFASCFYVLFKIRFVRDATQGLYKTFGFNSPLHPSLNPHPPPTLKTSSLQNLGFTAKSMGQDLSKKFHYNTQRCNYKTNSSESIKRHQYADV